MKVNEKSISESYEPSLNGHYRELFDELVHKLGNSLPINHVDLIEKEVDKITTDSTFHQNNVDTLKYIVSLKLLIDLLRQGWALSVKNGAIKLSLESSKSQNKNYIRNRLSVERNAQFAEPATRAFIKRMESEKKINGQNVSIRVLIGNPDDLIHKIESGNHVCCPYIQLVEDKKDELTGYKLSDIWRYFRYTWSIPYKTMPGRNLYYLVRDKSQQFHPVMGIFALGNSVLNLAVRDNEIGWTIDSIKKEMEPKKDVSVCEQMVSQTVNKKVTVKVCQMKEDEETYHSRVSLFADTIIPLLKSKIDDAIDDIYLKDLGYHKQTKRPKESFIQTLRNNYEELNAKSINNKNTTHNPNWEIETKTILFKKKRTSELANLLEAKLFLTKVPGTNNIEKLQYLLSHEEGKKTIYTALIANRKCKIGSNMMEIIVCGAIPPYNDLLGGKLISILACSPQVIRDYTYKYKNQISEIASRMKGKTVIRDSHLVHLGTTSLYSVGSSQYNRIKVPLDDGSYLQFKRLGITEGFGTVYFSAETTSLLSKILEILDGGKRINHVFGEGTSPRFRLLSRGMSILGLKSASFLKHYTPRIVYSINLAKNTNEFLMGYTDTVHYNFDIANDKQVREKTQYLIDYWYQRWMEKRLETVDIVNRLKSFNIESIILSNVNW